MSKPAASASPIKKPRGVRWFGVVTGVGALGMFLALVQQQRAMEAVVRRRVLVDEAVAAPPRPLAEVAKAVRAMKLVTVEIETAVTATVGDESWRGDIHATVSAPAKLLYGTDLGEMGVEAVGFSPVSRSYVVRIPRPSRIATEVWAEQESWEVTTGWMRLRSRAGEFYLGLARKSLTERARNLRLAEDDAEKVSRVTKEQVAALVKELVGNGNNVVVSYASPQGGAPQAGVGAQAAGGGEKVRP